MKAAIEVADVLEAHWPQVEQSAHINRWQLRTLGAVMRCRSAALGSHVDGCSSCGHLRISYNSCRNRHCPKCQGQQREKWIQAREAELLHPDIEKTNEVTIGFFRPLTFSVNLQNTGPYIFKRLLMPILVSLLLVGLTVISFVLMFRNLIKHRKLNQLKNEFVSNITHELKTPIATVGVAIEALRNFNAINDPQRTKEYLDISSAEIHRLGLLVDKVLKLSMFENKEIALQKEQFDLLELTREVMASMKLQFEKQNAVVTLESTGNDFVIEADKLHITSVIYNLLDNALKYSLEIPSIDVRLVAHKQHIALQVIDMGVGISNEYKGKIFEKFFRIPGGDLHNIKGYGMGLSYVNHIIQRHMGFIEVKSELGKGSTFIVNIPTKQVEVIRFNDHRLVR